MIRLQSLQRSTVAVLTIAFAFGIATLWSRSMWPYAIFSAALLLTASGWFLAGIRSDKDFSWWLLLPFTVAGIAAVQLVCGGTVNPWLTRQAGIEWMTNGCAAFLAYQVCSSDRLRVTVLRSFAVSAGGLALVSIVQNYSAPGRVFWLFPTSYSENVFGPFVYHTKLANFAELAIPIALWLTVMERRRATLYAGCAVTLIAAVIASGSRGGVAVIALELVVVTLIARRYRADVHSLSSTFAIATAVIIGVVVCGWELLATRLSSENAVDDIRLRLIATSAAMARRYWMVGSGLGTWARVYPEFATFDLGVVVNQAHCDWLQWLVEGGVPMFACMSLMFVTIARAVRREWWVIGLAFVWMHGVFDYPMQQTPAFAGLQIAVWGATVALNRRLYSRSAHRGTNEHLLPSNTAGQTVEVR